MRRGLSLIVLPLFLVMLQASARAQDILVPAGTLLHCTLDEPNLSSATANVGDTASAGRTLTAKAKS